jgi:hypothetical protein
MTSTAVILEHRKLQMDFEQVYGIAKFMLFLADKVSDDEYERLKQYQLEYCDQLAEESQHSEKEYLY